VISIKNLSKVYTSGKREVEALKNINLEINKGEIFGIIGFSGAGKSSLVRCLNLLEVPSKGTITIDGQEITSLKGEALRKARQEIGMIFQHFNLLYSRTVFDNIGFPLEIAGVSKEEIRPRVQELLRLVGLEDKSDSYPAQLSGGQKQRVGIARALANNPKVLLCDEATSALDPETTQSILKLLKNINEKLNLTIVLITHEMKVIKEICDTVAVMEAAEVVELGPVLKVFTEPKATTTRNFVSSVISQEVPEGVKSQLADKKEVGLVLKLSFIGDKAGKPIISTLVKEFDVDANILYANIDHIKETPFGTLILELVGQETKKIEAVEFLKNQDLKVEVISHA